MIKIELAKFNLIFSNIQFPPFDAGWRLGKPSILSKSDISTDTSHFPEVAKNPLIAPRPEPGPNEAAQPWEWTKKGDEAPRVSIVQYYGETKSPQKENKEKNLSRDSRTSV